MPPEVPAELLSRVEELCFDAGADAFRHCAPAWDGEDDCWTSVRPTTLPCCPTCGVTSVEDGVLAVPNAAEVFAARGIDTH